MISPKPARLPLTPVTDEPGWWLASFGQAEGLERALQMLGEPHHLPAWAESPAGAVVFDGVLYNRAELKNILEEAPEPASNDAGLLLRAYQRWGEGFLSRVKGIYALILWNRDRHLLLAVRDPLGIYPLFYANTNGNPILSTSIEALARHPSVSPALNRAALADHLMHRWPLKEETCFAEIFRVPPGHVLRVGDGVRRLYRHWDPAPPGTRINWVREEELEQFDELLDQAVNRCLEQGPAGIYLSGGLDSVSVAAVAADRSRRSGLPAPLALSLAFPDPECNEEAVQRRVAAGLGLPQLMVPLWEAVGSEGLLPAALGMSRDWPQPLLNHWLPAYFSLALAGRHRGCQVILTGNGGDEWLGVTPYLAADFIRTLDIKGLCSLWASIRRSFPLSFRAMLINFLWQYGVRPLLAGAVHRGATQVAPRFWRGVRLRRALDSTPIWVAPDGALRRELDQRAAACIKEPPLSGFYLKDGRLALDHCLVSWEMEETFESGRRLGLRVLHPYWDADLVDLLYRIPPGLLNKGGRSKGLVREALSRRFPEFGFERQKKIIAINFFRSTMLREGKKTWQAMGGAPALADLGVIDAAALAPIMEKILAGQNVPEAYRIWDVLSLEAWVRPQI